MQVGWPSAKLNPTVCGLACRWQLQSSLRADLKSFFLLSPARIHPKKKINKKLPFKITVHKRNFGWSKIRFHKCTFGWFELQPTTAFLDSPIRRWSKFTDLCQPFGRLKKEKKKTTVHNHSFGRYIIKVHNRNFGWSKTTVHNRNFGRSQITVHNRNFGRSRITVNNQNFGWSKITVHNPNFGPSKFAVHNLNFGQSKSTFHNCTFGWFK